MRELDWNMVTDDEDSPGTPCDKKSQIRSNPHKNRSFNSYKSDEEYAQNVIFRASSRNLSREVARQVLYQAADRAVT